MNSSLVKPLETITWDVEWWYDYLKINDKLFNGRLQPDGIIPNGSIHWVSDDNNTTGSGWKICSGNASKETDSWPKRGEVLFKSNGFAISASKSSIYKVSDQTWVRYDDVVL